MYYIHSGRRRYNTFGEMKTTRYNGRVMKSMIFRISTIVGMLSFLFSSSSSTVYGQTAVAGMGEGWTINQFHSDIQIGRDTSVIVAETIAVDFNDLQKHGIFRTIPVRYTTKYGDRMDIRFELLGVTDENGVPYQVSKSFEGDNVKLKIGSPSSTISGKNTYVIRYRVKRVVTRPNELAEFYWNATGDDWPVPILSSSATVTAPEGGIINSICFSGVFGSQTENCTHTSDGLIATFSHPKPLLTREGLTIAVALKPEFFVFPTRFERTLDMIRDNWLYGIPLVTLIAMCGLYWRTGRDKVFKHLFQHDTGEVETVGLFEHMTPTNVYGPPDNLSPGEVGVLVDEKVHMQDITAIAIDLARRGFFSMKEIEAKGLFSKPDFELTYSGKSETDLMEFERSVLELFFGVRRLRKTVLFSKLGSFDGTYEGLQSVRKDLYKHMVKQGFFYIDPDFVRKLWLSIALVVGFIGIAFMAFGIFFGSILGWVVAWVGSGIIIACFAPFMPARTAKGREALREALGLKEWIRIGAWREQIHEKHNFFEEVLPYTIAFGMTEKFIKAFKDADLKEAVNNMAWYHGQGAFSSSHFSSSFTSFGRGMSFTATASYARHTASSGGSAFSGSSGGGGGFSGGGFGGGGGGSW